MRKVLVETPFAAGTAEECAANVAYLRACLRECTLKYDEAPFASHDFYTHFLDDQNPEERKLGMDAGLLWGMHAEKTVVYVDRGITAGMRYGIARAKMCTRPIEYRMLGIGEVSEPISAPREEP